MRGKGHFGQGDGSTSENSHVVPTVQGKRTRGEMSLSLEPGYGHLVDQSLVLVQTLPLTSKRIPSPYVIYKMIT